MSKIIIIIGIISLLVGVASRLLMQPIPVPGGLEANALLSFASCCFLLAIALNSMCCKK